MARFLKASIIDGFPTSSAITGIRWAMHLKMRHVTSMSKFTRSLWQFQYGEKLVNVQAIIKSGRIGGINVSEILVLGGGGFIASSTLIPLLDGFIHSTRATMFEFQGKVLRVFSKTMKVMDFLQVAKW